MVPFTAGLSLSAMSVAPASDEVAEDYKSSLEDLVTNTRWEINNLTVIARENTEHALAISKVLENHIRTVSLNRRGLADHVKHCTAIKSPIPQRSS